MTNGFDKLLRESLTADAAADHGAECLDAALVAGWFDGTLSHAERTAVEAHAASCSRCQATIAALVRTDRPSPRVWWRAPAVRWLVPVAVAGAASLVVWIGVLRTGRCRCAARCGVRPPRASSLPRRLRPWWPRSAAAERGSSPDGRAGAADAAAKPRPPAGGGVLREKRERGRARLGMRRRPRLSAEASRRSAAAASSHCGNRPAVAAPLPQAPEPQAPTRRRRRRQPRRPAPWPAPRPPRAPGTDHGAVDGRCGTVPGAQRRPIDVGRCRARRRPRAADSVARPFRALADLRVGSGRTLGRRRCDVADADHRRERRADGRYRTVVECLLAGRAGAASC